MSSSQNPSLLRRYRIRRGYSLIEMVGLLVVLGSMMSLAGICLHRVTIMQKLALGAIRQTKMLDDLKARWRSDAAATIDVQATDQRAVLAQTDGGRVEYLIEPNQIVRRQFDPDAKLIVEGNWQLAALNWRVTQQPGAMADLLDWFMTIPRLPSDAGAAATDSAPTTRLAVHWISRMEVKDE